MTMTMMYAGRQKRTVKIGCIYIYIFIYKNKLKEYINPSLMDVNIVNNQAMTYPEKPFGDLDG